MNAVPKHSKRQRMLILHDWLNVKDGGAEKVFVELIKLYPDADIAALICNRQKFGLMLQGRKVRTSFLQYFPSWFKERPHLLLPFIRLAVNRLPTKGYDIVLASSSAWVKNAPLHGKSRMKVYCYSPARMLWDYWPRALTERTSSRLVRLYITWLASRLRLWDYQVSQESRREFAAISKVIARRITKYYHRNSVLIYPPVVIPPIAAVEKEPHYLMVSVLAEYKNVELALRAFMDTKRTLLVAGDGPDRERLEALAAGRTNIRFLGRVLEADKWRLLRTAQAFIFCNIEDFGIAPVEAMACGTPVIALAGGGLTETVIAGQTGLFFDQPTVPALRAAIAESESKTWSAADMHRQASRFSEQHFKDAIQKFVGQT